MLEKCRPPIGKECDRFEIRKGCDSIKCPVCGKEMPGDFDKYFGEWVHKCENCNVRCSTVRNMDCHFAADGDELVFYEGRAKYIDKEKCVEVSLYMPPFYDDECDCEYLELGYTLLTNSQKVYVKEPPSEEEIIAYALAAFKVGEKLYANHSQEVIKRETAMFWEECLNDIPKGINHDQ